MSISIASANEVEVHLRRALALKMLDAQIAHRLIEEVSQIRRMLIAFRKALDQREVEEGSNE